jgi:hypothetical protein
MTNFPPQVSIAVCGRVFSGIGAGMVAGHIFP